MSRFKVGDKVWMKHNPEKCGVIVAIDEDNYKRPYDVKTDVLIDMYSECELLGVKEAFLERLQSLLREFDASINIGWNEYFDSDKCTCIDMDITFGNGRGICFSNALGKTISADTIMDFDKE